MTSKFVTTVAVLALVGGLASVARAADTGPVVPPTPPAPTAPAPAPTGNNAMMGGGAKMGPQDHGMAGGGQMGGGKMEGGKMEGGGMMPMSDMMAMMNMMKDRHSDGSDIGRMSMMLQMNMMLEMNMMMQMNMMEMMHGMIGELHHGGEGHAAMTDGAMMDGGGKPPMPLAKPQGAMPPG